MVFENLIPFFYDHGILLSFFGGLLGGEAVMMTLAFFWANNLLPLRYIIIFATLGALISDTMWFFIGKTKIINSLSKLNRISKVFKKVDGLVLKLKNHHVFKLLFYTKFIYLASPPTIAYLGLKKTPFKKFIILETIVTLIWMVPLILIGGFAGSSFKWIATIFKNVQIALLLLIIFIILLAILRKWLSNSLIKGQKQLN